MKRFIYQFLFSIFLLLGSNIKTQEYADFIEKLENYQYAVKVKKYKHKERMVFSAILTKKNNKPTPKYAS